ncbi:MAG: hypothetical protein ABFR97_06250 [Thermodesulfobacteriota bacterium]
MHRLTNPNIELLEGAVARLEGLVERLVFLGGCATGLLITDNASPPIRYTHDVDVLTEVANRADYYRLAELLREKGFLEDSSEDAPVCRWKCGPILLDVMPTDQAILGFANEWYKEALEKAGEHELPSGARIRMITAPYFLACKLAAFAGRGNGDFQLSHDIEDLLAVIDGRPELLAELRAASAPLKQHLGERFAELLSDGQFRQSLPGHMPGDASSQARVPIIVRRLESISQLT